MSTENTTPKIEIRTKTQLRQYLDMGASTLRYLMNDKYHDQLKELGYEKNKSILSPKVVRGFIKIWGKNLSDDEI